MGAFLNLLVALIVGKTVAPEMLDCSRCLFAWAQDGFLPRALLHTSRTRAPDVALVTAAVIGFLFLLEATFVGWQIGVTLRSMSLVLVFGVLGLGALNVRLNRRYQDLGWARELRGRPDLPVLGVLAAVVAVVLLSSVLVTPGLKWYFQPSFQALVALVIAAAIFVTARPRLARGAALEMPAE